MTLIEVLVSVGAFCALLSLGLATWRAVTNHVYARFDALDARFDVLDAKLGSITATLLDLSTRVGRLEGR